MCLCGLLMLESIEDPVPVVLQQVILKEPDLHFQIIVVLELLLLLILVLLDLLLWIIFCLPHTTFQKVLLS